MTNSPATAQRAQPLTLAAIVEARAKTVADRKAVLIDHHEVTYGDLRRKAEVRARQMLRVGVQPGDRVGVLLPNCQAYLEIVLGAAMIGAVCVPMNMRYKSRELRHLIIDSGMSMLYTLQAVEEVVDFASLLVEALPELAKASDRYELIPADAPNLKAIVALDAANAFMLLDTELARHAGALPAPPTPEQPLLIMYTSGTTSNPKGCIVPNRAIVSNAWAIVDAFNIGTDDVWWCPLPMFHIGGLLFVITMLAAGGLYSGVGHFDAAKAVEAIERTPPTVFYPLFPTITLPIIDHPRFAQLDHSKMRYMFNLAPEGLQRRVQAFVPHAPILGAFGMTETCGTVCYGAPDDPQDKRYNTCGRPLPGWSLKIVDPATHAEVACGERGEIAVRGVGLFGGYFNQPEMTRRQHLPDGYFLTGDVGSVDEDGRLSFHGRFKDQLKVGGENVAALEVESFLMTHPAVALAQVVGVPDEKYGEVVAAFIELKEGAIATDQDIIGFCSNKIARFKIPRYVRFRSEWPMSATKIVKYRLREALEAELFGGLR